MTMSMCVLTPSCNITSVGVNRGGGWGGEWLVFADVAYKVENVKYQ